MAKFSLSRSSSIGPSPRIALVYGALYVGFGLNLPFFPLWLAERGLSATEIGIVLALPLLQRLVSLPLATALADRLGPLKRAVVLYAAVGAAIAALYLPARGFWPILAVTAALAAVWTALTPILDALTVGLARKGAIDYGRVRLWGSITFMVAATFGGVLIDRFGTDLLVPLIVASLALTGLLALLLPAGEEREHAGEGPPSLIAGWKLLLGPPGILFILIGSSLIQASHSVLYTFGSVHWKVLGFSETTIGALWAIPVLAEIALFFVSAWVLAHFGTGKVLLLAALASLVRWTILALDPPLAVVVAVQILHAFTFAGCHVATVNLLAGAVPARFAATAQGAFVAIHGAINGTAFVASGPLYATFVGGAYLAMTLTSALGTLALAIGLARASRANAYPQSARAGG